VEMNDVINKREHFTDFILHLKPERGYALAVKMLEAMAKNPSDKCFKGQLPLEQRKLVLWGDVNVFLPNYYTLCASNSKPDFVINIPPSQLDTMRKKELKRKSDEFFVVLTPSKQLDEQRRTLQTYGYKEGVDYIELVNTPFILEWQE